MMRFIQILGKIKRINGWIMLKTMSYVLMFHILDMVKQWKKIPGLA